MKDKQGNSYDLQTVTNENFSDVSATLARAYATDFWAGSWQELLAIRKQGNVVQQFGTNDDETARLAKRAGVDITRVDWPLRLWELACSGRLGDIEPYWTLEDARAELVRYVRPTEDGGYGGTILVLKDAPGDIVGFSAHTVVPVPDMLSLAEQRFPYTGLTARLAKTWPDIAQIGIYLDFAISEKLRGRGLGSQLFDARLQAMLDDSADAIMGRTIKTSPAQFFGNYIRRGMHVLYKDPHNPDKCILGMHKKEVKPR